MNTRLSNGLGNQKSGAEEGQECRKLVCAKQISFRNIEAGTTVPIFLKQLTNFSGSSFQFPATKSLHAFAVQEA